MDLLDDDELMDVGPRAKRSDPNAVTKELRSKRKDLGAENSALGKWAEGLGGDKVDSFRDVAERAEDECHLCTAVGRKTCEQCGKKACASHFWVMFGLCRSCATEDRVKAWHKDAKPESKNWLG